MGGNCTISPTSYRLNPLGPIAPNVVIILSASSCDFLAMSLGDRFCDSRKGGTGGGGRVHPEVANSMAVSGLRSRKVLVGTGRTISIDFGIRGVRK